MRRRETPGRRSSDLHHLARIHAVVRVERPLDRSHHVDRTGTGLSHEESHLVQPDSVFPSAGAFECQRPRHQRVAQLLGSYALFGCVRVKKVAEMEIAIPDVTDQEVGDATGIGLGHSPST